MLRIIYIDNPGTLLCDQRRMPLFFERTFMQDIVRLCEEDLGLYTGNPVVPGNDSDDREIARTLAVSCQQQPTTVCDARFQSFGEPFTVKYFFMQQAGNWLITDIIDAHGQSFREALEELRTCTIVQGELSCR